MNKTLSDKEIIALYLENKGISKNSFYVKTGFSVGFLDSGKSLGVDKLRIILDNYPDFDPSLLLENRVSSKDKNAPVAVNDPSHAYQTKKSIPLVNANAVAGFGNENFSVQVQDVKSYFNIPAFKHKQVDFMIEIDGSSMYPKYSSGDIVACTVLKERQFIQWNKVHVVATKEQGLIVKRIHEGANGCLKMVSDNDNYPPFLVPEEQITGIALVVGVIRLE